MEGEKDRERQEDFINVMHYLNIEFDSNINKQLKIITCKMISKKTLHVSHFVIVVIENHFDKF